MLSSYKLFVIALFHALLIAVAFGTDKIENDCKDSTMKFQCDGSASRNVYQFFGDSGCQANIKQYIDDAISTLFAGLNKSLERLEERINAKLETLERQIDYKLDQCTNATSNESWRSGNNLSQNGYQYYEQDKFWYKFRNDCKPWSDARHACQQEGGDLISLNVNNYNFFKDVARSNIGRCSHVWVGADDIAVEGEWHWLNGEKVNSTFWYTNQPDNTNDEDCAELNSNFHYSLNDHYCRYEEHFLCQIF